MTNLKSFINLFAIIFLAGIPALNFGQTVYLTNPSFEDIPGANRIPQGWYDCGYQFPGESPPDVQPSGSWQVRKEAAHGNTYVGMVVRDNDTWESITQPLSGPLLKGKTYKFSLFLCSSEIYLSGTRRTVNTEVKYNFITPAKLRIYGGNSLCAKDILLDESDVISNNDWREYVFTFRPTQTVTHIVLEAFYKTPVLVPYNGNILVDNASAITEVVANKPEVVQKPTKPTTTAPPKNSMAALDGKKVKTGQTIRIDELYFGADSANINSSSHQVLDDLYRFMVKNPKVRIEVGGHTNSIPSVAYCDRLSADRAKAVADYLVKKGINRSRITYKGYGKRQPLASDKTADGRRKNQRVEIKILSTVG